MKNALSTIYLIAWSGFAFAQTYTVTDLGALGGQNSEAAAINAIGQVTGTADIPGNAIELAFLYSNGSMQDLGTLGGTISNGAAINASGQVTGTADTASTAYGQPVAHAFLYSNGLKLDLGPLGGTYSFGYGINNRGEAVGVSETSGDALTHAFLYSNGSMQDLGGLGGSSSSAAAINDRGQLTGLIMTTAANGIGIQRAFLYTNGSVQELGALGGMNSEGAAINASGQVTGEADTRATDSVGNPISHAFRYVNGSMQDLGTLGGTFIGSRGLGINARGEVVGTSYTSNPNATYHAFLYRNGKMVDLNDHVSSSVAALYSLTKATGINDEGQIAVNGSRGTSPYVAHALLLTPVHVALSALLEVVRDAGPGELEIEVSLARSLYSIHNLRATCAVLADFVNEVQAQDGKKIGQALDAQIVADANAIEAAICGK